MSSSKECHCWRLEALAAAREPGIAIAGVRIYLDGHSEQQAPAIWKR
ncbi:hypothetical protein ACFQZE_23835 [Paenibacillus sp. GCM10027627]